MDEERIREIIEEVLIRNGLLSVFAKNINGVDTEFPEFKERTEKRLQKLEDILEADLYDYKTETKLIKQPEPIEYQIVNGDGEVVDTIKRWISYNDGCEMK